MFKKIFSSIFTKSFSKNRNILFVALGSILNYVLCSDFRVDLSSLNDLDYDWGKEERGGGGGGGGPARWEELRTVGAARWEAEANRYTQV